MDEEIYNRMSDFTTEELIDMLEISEDDILERFSDRVTKDQVPFVFDEGF